MSSVPQPWANTAKREEEEKRVDLNVFVEMHRLVVDVVAHEEVVDAGEERHLGQREDVHELLHGVAVGALKVNNG